MSDVETPSMFFSKSKPVSWLLFLVAGMVAVAGSKLSTSLASGPWHIRLPQEYFDISYEAFPNPERQREAFHIKRSNYQQNYCLLLFVVSTDVTIPFGLIFGLKCGGWLRSLTSVFLAGVIGFAIAIAVGPLLVRMTREFRLLEMDSLLKGMLIHWASWLAIGMNVIIILTYARRSLDVIPRTVLGIVLGTGISVVAVVLIGATFDKQNHVEMQYMPNNWSQNWWAILPVLCFTIALGFFEADGVELFERERDEE